MGADVKHHEPQKQWELGNVDVGQHCKQDRACEAVQTTPVTSVPAVQSVPASATTYFSKSAPTIARSTQGTHAERTDR